ncbi:MAG: type IV pilus twitching motility protein PilT [bacterium]
MPIDMKRLDEIRRRRKAKSLHNSLQMLFRTMLDNGASDLHLTSGYKPMLRILGDLLPVDFPPLSPETAVQIFYSLITPEQRSLFEMTGNLDFSHEIMDGARLRVNYMKQYYGMSAVFRLIPDKIPTVEELNLPQVVKEISLYRRGLVIVTGPTGSGKSTTLAAMLNHINENRPYHIITIEDPIEFSHTQKRSLIDHREVGTHTLTFSGSLRAALREDPDVILVGEMRDLETMSLALKAAETGVLVLTTLHTNSAAKTVDRIVDSFPAKEQEQIRSMLADSLKAVIAQQLIKTRDGKGRVAAVEILIATSGLPNIIREGKTGHIPLFIETGKSDKMQTMDTSLISFVRQGKITAAAAREYAQDLSAFERAGL